MSETAHDQPKTHAVVTTMNGGEPVPMTAGEVHDHTVWGSIQEIVEEGAEAVRDFFEGREADAQAERDAAEHDAAGVLQSAVSTVQNTTGEPQAVEAPANTSTKGASASTKKA